VLGDGGGLGRAPPRRRRHPTEDPRVCRVRRPRRRDSRGRRGPGAGRGNRDPGTRGGAAVRRGHRGVARGSRSGAATGGGRPRSRRGALRLAGDRPRVRDGRRRGRPRMTAVAAALAGLSLALFAWSYLVYPALVARLARRRARPLAAAGPPPDSADVLVSAADEESVIGARVRDLLAQPEARRIVVACDGCRDGTAEAARAAGGDRVRVVEFPVRRGK